MTSKTNNKGYTVIELEIVIAIISILIVMAIPLYFNIKQQAEQKACKSNLDTIQRMFHIEASTSINTTLTIEQYLISNIDDEYACKFGGIITTNEEGKLICSKHITEDGHIEETNAEDNPVETIPWLYYVGEESNVWMHITT